MGYFHTSSAMFCFFRGSSRALKWLSLLAKALARQNEAVESLAYEYHYIVYFSRVVDLTWGVEVNSVNIWKVRSRYSASIDIRLRVTFRLLSSVAFRIVLINVLSSIEDIPINFWHRLPIDLIPRLHLFL